MTSNRRVFDGLQKITEIADLPLGRFVSEYDHFLRTVGTPKHVVMSLGSFYALRDTVDTAMDSITRIEDITGNASIFGIQITIADVGANFFFSPE